MFVWTWIWVNMQKCAKIYLLTNELFYNFDYRIVCLSLFYGFWRYLWYHQSLHSYCVVFCWPWLVFCCCYLSFDHRIVCLSSKYGVRFTPFGMLKPYFDDTKDIVRSRKIKKDRQYDSQNKHVWRGKQYSRKYYTEN
jgi:hypothetical protein